MVSKEGTTAEKGTNGRGTGKAETNVPTTAAVRSQGTTALVDAPPSTRIGPVLPATIRTLLAEQLATDAKPPNPVAVEVSEEISAPDSTTAPTVVKRVVVSVTTVPVTTVASTTTASSAAKVEGTSTTTIGPVPRATTRTSRSGMHAIDARLHGRAAAVEDDVTAVTGALKDAAVEDDVTAVTGVLKDVAVEDDVTAVTGVLKDVTAVTDALEGATTVKTNATMLMEAIERHEGSAKDMRTTSHHVTSVRLEDSIGKTKIEVVK